MEFFKGTLERVATLVTLFLVFWLLYRNNPEVEYGWAVWCIWLLTLVLEYLAVQKGIITGIVLYRNLTPEQRRDVDKIIGDENL